LCAAGQAAAPSAISAEVAALTEEVLRSMALTKTKTAAVLLAVGSLVGLGLAGAALRPDAEEKAPARPSTARTLRLPDTPYRYADVELPAHFQTPAARSFDNTPADNPVTDHGATLGRVLFYDTRLSANNTVSCGSCHVQKNAFVD